MNKQFTHEDSEPLCDLTVATVCCNAMSTLPRCVASVARLQTGELKVEHLLIDNCSTDGTLEYLEEELKTGRMMRLICEPDDGIYSAMNKAIFAARGKIIVFINADDEICADVVPACCAPILEGRAQYTVADALCISETKKEVFKANMRDIMWRQPYCHQSMFCSKKLLLEFGGFNAEKFKIGADTELMRRLYISGVSYEVVEGIASHFFLGGASSSDKVVGERFRLMLHFGKDYCTSLEKNPHDIAQIIKHMRRYASRKIFMTAARDEQFQDYEKIRFFFEKLAQHLPTRIRWMYWFLMLLDTIWYFGVARLINQSSNNMNKIKGRISAIVRTALSGRN